MNRLHIDSAPETNCLHSPMALTFGGAAHLATRSRSASMSFQLELLTEKYPVFWPYQALNRDVANA